MEGEYEALENALAAQHQVENVEAGDGDGKAAGKNILVTRCAHHERARFLGSRLRLQMSRLSSQQGRARFLCYWQYLKYLGCQFIDLLVELAGSHGLQRVQVGPLWRRQRTSATRRMW